MENNRLQFRHCNKIFDTREDAIEYIKVGIKFDPTPTGIAFQDTSHRYSLYGEPTVLRYKNVTSWDPTGEKKPHLILVIGSKTNECGVDCKNKFCIIDIDKTEEEIADLGKALEDAIRSLTLTAIDSDTLKFYVNKTESGTTISGDVLLPESHVFEISEDNKPQLDNNLMVASESLSTGEAGIFLHIDLKYNEDKESFTFTVNNSDGTLDITEVPLLNNYVVSGEYTIADQSIHLTLKDGQDVAIDCTRLIDEWTVDGGTKTPVILKKEEVLVDGSEYNHEKPWRDVLFADVRLKDEAYNEETHTYYPTVTGSTNILKRTADGTELYVDGRASNIKCWSAGTETNVQAAIDTLSKLKISNDSQNIIVGKVDGFFASVNIDYIKKFDTVSSGSSIEKQYLRLLVSGIDGDTGQITTKTKDIEIPIAKFVDRVFYDETTEELVIVYTDGAGTTQFTRIPVGEIISEWDVTNEGHTVHLDKTPHQVAGKDLLSADVNIATTAPNNILEDRNHQLYVNGIASNIKYDVTGTTNVKNVLDTLSGQITTEIARATAEEERIDTKLDDEIARATAEEDRIDATIGDGFSTDTHETVTYMFNTLSGKVDTEIARATAEEERIDTKLDDEIARATAEEDRIDTKLDDEIARATEKDNLHDAEIAAVSANTIASLKAITSDNNTILTNVTSSSGPQAGFDVDLNVNLSHEIEDCGANIIKINYDGIYAGVDLLYNFNETTGANQLIFKTTNGTKVYELKTNSVVDKIYYDPIREAIIIEYTINGHRMPDVVVPVGDLVNEWRVEDGHPHAVQLEKVRAASGTSEQDVLKASVVITTSHDDNILVMDEGSLYVSNSGITANAQAIAQEVSDRIDDVNAEESRAMGEETRIELKLDDEIARSTSEDVELTNKIGTGFTSASDNNVTAKFEQLSNAVAQETADINAEVTRAISAETALDTKIDSEITRATNAESVITTTLNNEITRSTTKDAAHDEAILNNTTAIATEQTRATAAENALDNKVTAEINRAVSAETALDTKINTEITRASDAEAVITTALNNEVTRSIAKDTALEDSLDAEIARATAEDNAIRTDLMAEANRAASAETALDTKIDAEITRATNAETTLTTALNNEVIRATAAENNLVSSLNEEIERAINAEGALNTRINENVLVFDDTNSIDFTKTTSSTSNTITASVKLEDNDGNNIIKIGNGLYANVNLTYDSGRNELVFEKTNSSGTSTSVIPLNAGSIINNMYYDDATKELVIEYEDGASVEHTVRVDVAHLFNEWVCDSNHLGAILLNKSIGTGVDGSDVLSASVVVSTLSSNILVNDAGSLYVDGSGISANTQAIASEQLRAQGEEATLAANLATEATNRSDADIALDNKISAETAAREADVDAEESRAIAVEQILTNAINGEIARAQSAETSISSSLANEVTRSIGRDDALEELITSLSGAIGTETANRTSADVQIQSQIDTLSTNLATTNTNLQTESSRATAAETALGDRITAETNRATAAEGDIRLLITQASSAANESITAEQTRAISAETALDGRITSVVNNLNISNLTLKTSNGSTTTTVGTYNPLTGAKDFTINVPDFDSLRSLTIQSGIPSSSVITYEPNGRNDVTMNVPTSLKHLSEWKENGEILTVNGNLNVTQNVTVSGTITSQGAIYSSDINLKENIDLANFNKKLIANSIDVKQFNFKDDPNKAIVYGIIAQDLEERGLGDIVYTKEDGFKAVDYTSLMMLKIAYLENDNRILNNALTDLVKRIEDLESKKK